MAALDEVEELDANISSSSSSDEDDNDDRKKEEEEDVKPAALHRSSSVIGAVTRTFTRSLHSAVSYVGLAQAPAINRRSTSFSLKVSQVQA